MTRAMLVASVTTAYTRRALLACSLLAATAACAPAAHTSATTIAPTGVGSFSLARSGASAGYVQDRFSGRRLNVEQTLYVDAGARNTASSAFDVVQRMRPNFLNPRGHVTSNRPGAETIGVYLDGSYAGGPEALRSISASSVRAIHRVSGSVAPLYFHRSHMGGVLYVEMEHARR